MEEIFSWLDNNENKRNGVEGQIICSGVICNIVNGTPQHRAVHVLFHLSQVHVQMPISVQLSKYLFSTYQVY